MHKVILFDFFGVFATSMASNWFKKTSAASESGIKKLQALCLQGDLGKLSKAEFNIEAAKLAGVSAAEVEKGIEAELHLSDSLVVYVESLIKRGYRVACLSNGSHEWTTYAIKKYGLERLFEQIIISSDLGIVKPDPRIYFHALDALKIKPSDCIFIDDRSVNTEAAESIGIRSIVFTDTRSLKVQLEDMLQADYGV